MPSKLVSGPSMHTPTTVTFDLTTKSRWVQEVFTGLVITGTLLSFLLYFLHNK